MDKEAEEESSEKIKVQIAPKVEEEQDLKVREFVILTGEVEMEKAGLRLGILLFQYPKCWDYRFSHQTVTNFC